jgi:hypothetical protein
MRVTSSFLLAIGKTEKEASGHDEGFTFMMKDYCLKENGSTSCMEDGGKECG